MYIITATIWNFNRLKWLLQSLKYQTYKNFFLYIILDKTINHQEKQEFEYFIKKYINNFQLITNVTENFNPQNNVSYNRNRIFKNKKLNKFNFVFWVDDDNKFDRNFLENLQNSRHTIYKKIRKEFILSPKINYRQTSIYQSLWIKKFNCCFSKLQLIKIPPNQNFWEVEMIGWNSLFWPILIFKQNPFDEKFKFIYEDIDWSKRLTNKKIPIIIANNLKIYHMEREKNILEKIFIWTPQTAYFKSRNRIWFVKKNFWIWCKILFFTLGLWIQTFRFVVLILLFWKNKLKLLTQIFRWIKDGITL